VRFGEALHWALRKLALDIVRDGEVTMRIGRVVVSGGSEEVVVRAARAVATSPLVKAAVHGGDPNWGRIAQAVGAAVPDAAPLALDIFI
jgi:glutamate N-acetyltransferase/amino-acid N-acetyltransferase